jgi:dTDP-4-amino-4,6-dideoxygalactose transaminase
MCIKNGREDMSAIPQTFGTMLVGLLRVCISGDIQCVSFHAKKLLKIGQGGAILHDNEEADIFFRAMRFDGRTEGVLTNEDTYPLCGYHCYMSPPDASRGLWLIQDYPQYMPDIPTADYPDMSRWSWPR